MASLRPLIARAPGGARRSGGSDPSGTGRKARIAALVAALILPAGLGCTGFGKTKADVAQALRIDKPQAASQMICFWQRRPQHLPDPTRDGIMAPGLVGQLFLLTPDGKPVDITGDLIVQALDETKRPAGQPYATPAIWHIDKVALKKLATKDERFGTCYALFLPWPAEWKDVTNVRMQAKYVAKPGPDLFASDVSMTLEFSAPGATVPTESGGVSTVGYKPSGPSDLRGIPDLAKAFRNQATTANSTPVQAAVPTTAFPPTAFPPTAPAGPGGAPAQYSTTGAGGAIVTTKTWTAPVPPVAPAPPLAGTVVPTVPTVVPPSPPVQLVDFGAPPMPGNVGQARPVPTAPPPALPPAIPDDARRSWGTPPGPNGGLPPIELPAAPGPGALQPVVIPRL